MDKLVDERDGQEYQTVQIGDQLWLAENFRFDSGIGSQLVETDHGPERYYRWDAALRAVPEGWRVATNADYNRLLKQCGGGYTEGALADSGRGGESAFTFLKEGGPSNFNFRPNGFISKGEHYAGTRRGALWTSSESAVLFRRGKVCVLFDDKVGMDERDKDLMFPIRLIQGKQKPHVKAVSGAVQKIILDLARYDSAAERKQFLENLPNYNRLKRSDRVFIDERDYHVYSLVPKNGKMWLGENLRFETAGAGLYGNYPPYLYPFGYYYTYEEAEQALPEGFRIANAEEWKEICQEIPINRGYKNYRVSSTNGVSSINLMEAGRLYEEEGSALGSVGHWWCQEPGSYVQLSRMSAEELHVVDDSAEYLSKVKIPLRCVRDA